MWQNPAQKEQVLALSQVFRSKVAEFVNRTCRQAPSITYTPLTYKKHRESVLIKVQSLPYTIRIARVVTLTLRSTY